MSKLIGYCRVSTKEQGESRNGLEAQEEDIRKYAAAHGLELVKIVYEVASGKLPVSQRPVLKEALEACNKQKATLICSKVDRLARKASIVMGLTDAKTKFIIVALGKTVDLFVVHLHAVVAELDRANIASRTSSALQALKRKGVKLGNPNYDDVDLGDVKKIGLVSASKLGAEQNKILADKFAESMKDIISPMLAAGYSYNKLAIVFNTNGVDTARGGKWTAKSISNVVARF